MTTENTPYDSTADTQAHIDTVRSYLNEIVNELRLRAAIHDASKLAEPEKAVFDEFTPKLANSTYGSEEYKSYLQGMGEGLDHHYAFNDHHPEHGSPDLAWQPVVGYEGWYEVSNYGDVRSVTRVVKRDGPRGDQTVNGRDLKANVTPKGYLRIQLNRDGVSANRLVHVLVAEAFIPNPDGKTEVNHENGDKCDNRATNLSWATPGENQKHAYDTGLKEPAVKWVVHCPELDLTTLGIDKMVAALHERGYEQASSGGVWNAMDREGRYLGLTFEGTLLAEARRSQTHDMDLIQTIEMLADWKAATLRHADGNLNRSISQNATRFGYGPEIEHMLRLTASRLGWIDLNAEGL